METEPRYNEPSLSCSEQNFASPLDLPYIHVPLCFESPSMMCGPVAREWISANPQSQILIRISFSFIQKDLISRIIFFIQRSNHPIVDKKNQTEFGLNFNSHELLPLQSLENKGNQKYFSVAICPHFFFTERLGFQIEPIGILRKRPKKNKKNKIKSKQSTNISAFLGRCYHSRCVCPSLALIVYLARSSYLL